MELSGQHRIPAGREEVWQALNDPEVLKECIPGCKSLEKTEDGGFAAKVAVKIGPVKATMSGNVTLSDIDPPNGYTITGEGKGAAAGFAKGSAGVKLTEDGDATVLAYDAKGQVGGKLAQLGARLVDATAKEMADKFFTAFAEKLGAGAEDSEAAEESGASDEGPLERAEHAVEHAVEETVHAAQEVEQAAEVAAGRGVLGGPAMWGILALAALVLIVILTR